MSNSANRKILAASFATPDAGSRAVGVVGGGLPEKLGNGAVLVIRPDGKVKFVESKDWGAGRGALVGGVIGILGGPPGMIIGAGIGALASKLRDSGFKNDQLEQLGKALSPGNSAMVVEIASDAVEKAKELIQPFSPLQVVVEDVDESVAGLFAAEAAPAPEPEG